MSPHECPIWRWVSPSEVDEPDEEHMPSDELLLHAVDVGESPTTVRCYAWRKPAVTIGRHQEEAPVRDAFPGLPIFRRPTGGRAVLHGDDLTIVVAAHNRTLGIPAGKTVSVMNAYSSLVAPVHDSLSRFGILTKPGNATGQKSRTIARVDCFAHAAQCDVVDAKHGIKMVGCALKRSSEASLLQMSLRPLQEIGIFSREFLDELRARYERCFNIGLRDVAER